MASASVCVVSRRSHLSAGLLRQPCLGRRASVEKYQKNIIDQIRGKQEHKRKSWEEDIKRHSASPVSSRRSSLENLDHDSVDGSDDITQEFQRRKCVISRRESRREGGVTQWTIKVKVQNETAEDSLSVRVDADCVRLETRHGKEETLEEVVSLTGTVLPETVKVQPSGLDMLTVRVCTKL